MWRFGDPRKLAGDRTRSGGFDRKWLLWRILNYQCLDCQVITPDNVTVTERKERPRHEEQQKNIQPNAAAAYFCLLSLSLSLYLSLFLSHAFCSIDLSRKRKDEPCFGSHLEHLKNHLAHHSLQPESIRAAAEAEDLLLHTEQAPHHGGRSSPKTPRPTIIL